MKVFNVSRDYALVSTIKVGSVPHGIWPSPDGKLVYVGLEYSDQVQGIDLQTMQVISTIQTGQSPQALVYASKAGKSGAGKSGLSNLEDTPSTQVLILGSLDGGNAAVGRLSIRSIGLADLLEQLFTGLAPNTSYTLAFTKSSSAPFNADYPINSFTTNEVGWYTGQSTGLVKSVNNPTVKEAYVQVIVINNASKEVVLLGKD